MTGLRKILRKRAASVTQHELCKSHSERKLHLPLSHVFPLTCLISTAFINPHSDPESAIDGAVSLDDKDHQSAEPAQGKARIKPVPSQKESCQQPSLYQQRHMYHNPTLLALQFLIVESRRDVQPQKLHLFGIFHPNFSGRCLERCKDHHTTAAASLRIQLCIHDYLRHPTRIRIFNLPADLATFFFLLTGTALAGNERHRGETLRMSNRRG